MNVFIQSIYLQILLGLFIFWKGWKLLPPKKSYRIPFASFFIAELAIFFTGYFFRKTLPDNILIGIFYICGTWYVSSIYITLCLLAVELVKLTDKWLRWYPSFVIRNKQKIKLSLFFGIMIFVILLMIKGYHNATNPIVKSVDITLPKKESSRDSMRVVMISDTHFGEMIGKNAAKKFVALANSQHPDMVVVTGDVLDYESRFAENEHIEEELRQLKAPLGVYIVNGNHEYRANRFAKFRWLEKTGAVHLVDSVVSPDSTFYLVGRDDFINKNRKPLQALLHDVERNKPIIVLDHQPWSFAEMNMNGADLGLHGHTHNGQLWPYPLVLKLIYECPNGYYKKGPTQFYVSSGAGFAGPPYRIGTRSEIVVLNIKFQ